MFPVTGSILSVTSFQDHFVHRQLVHKRSDQLVTARRSNRSNIKKSQFARHPIFIYVERI